MPKLSEAELLARDVQRDLNAVLLESAEQLRAGRLGRVSVVTRDGRVIDSPVTKARLSTRMSQSQFATLLGVSKRTLQDWEQGRREPSGAAKTLLRVAERHPEVLREMIET
jgi:putative transcriptional regulator